MAEASEKPFPPEEEKLAIEETKHNAVTDGSSSVQGRPRANPEVLFDR
jgi:hypothetical protein